MIRLFSANETNFNSNGDHVIKSLSLIETKKKSLNGWEIEVALPIKYKDLISQDMLCVVKTKSRLNPQAFRINNIKHTSRRITFTANHVMYDASRYFLLDVRPTEMSAIGALNWTNERTEDESPFSYTSNVAASNTAYFIRKNLLEAWQIIEERWGGVFDADNFNITFKTDTPVDKGATLNYGVDLQGVEVIEDWSSVVTTLFPTGPNGIMIPEQKITAAVSYEKPYVKTIQFDSDLQGEDPEEIFEPPLEDLITELRQKATEYILINQYPKVSYTVKSDVKQDLEIGDLVVVRHPYVQLSTQVQEYRFNIQTGRVTSLTFGNYNRDVKKKFNQIKESIQNNQNKLNNVEILVANQTDLINSLNKNGFVYIDDNEILILDELPKENAAHVWRFGLGGLGYSSNGYEGPFEYAFTQDGKFNASFISAGAIQANMLASDVGSSLDISSNASVNILIEDKVVEKISEIEIPPGPRGDKGDAGTGIASTEIAYALSTSGTDAPTSGWDSTIPTLTQSRYLWTRNRTTLTDSTVKDSYSVAYIALDGTDGTDGSKGDVGTGIESIETEFYLSDSKTNQTGGSWSKIMPTWSEGKYLWTRNEIVYKNPTSTGYTTPAVDSSWEAVNGVQVGGSNLLINGSGELRGFEYWTFYPENTRLMFHKSLLYRKALTNYTTFDIVTNENSLSGNNLSFFANGKALNGLFRTYPDNECGFRFKRVSGNQDFNIEIHEFDENKGYIGKRVYTFDNTEVYGTISNITFESETSFFALLYDVQASFSNRLVLTELMFNVGNPKTYEKNPDVIEEGIRTEVLNRITRVETDTTAKITANTESISLEKSERETQYGTLENTVSKQGSSINMLNDQVNITVESRLTNAEGTLENINETVSTVESTQQTFTDRITNLEGEMIEQQTFFRTGIDGLTIGGTDWETVMHADGERISFQSQTGSIQAHFGANGMYVNRWETDFHAIEKFEEGITLGTIFQNRRSGS